MEGLRKPLLAATQEELAQAFPELEPSARRFPARCLLTGERRTIPGETVDQVERELGEIAGEAALRIIASSEPYEAPTAHPFVELVGRAADAGNLV
jgi:acetylornithine deacetylase/succinyl-diaminopimelate desuccinylase-like protein